MKMDLQLRTDFFYQRIETEQGIEVTFLGLPFVHMLFWFVIFISLLSLGKYTSVALSAFCLGLFFYIGLSWKVLIEIRRAMLTTGVFIMGSQLSIQNPLKVVIRKE